MYILGCLSFVRKYRNPGYFKIIEIYCSQFSMLGSPRKSSGGESGKTEFSLPR
jgi:hypothetical protein